MFLLQQREEFADSNQTAAVVYRTYDLVDARRAQRQRLLVAQCI